MKPSSFSKLTNSHIVLALLFLVGAPCSCFYGCAGTLEQARARREVGFNFLNAPPFLSQCVCLSPLCSQQDGAAVGAVEMGAAQKGTGICMCPLHYREVQLQYIHVCCWHCRSLQVHHHRAFRSACFRAQLQNSRQPVSCCAAAMLMRAWLAL